MFSIVQLVVAFFIVLFSSTLGNRTCDTETIVYNQCSETETCIPATGSNKGYCECHPGLIRVNSTHCKSIINRIKEQQTPKSSSLVDKGANSNNGNIVAGILIPIFLIMVVICGVYCSRKYNLFNYLRNKMYQRSINYDEVMIGQDLDDDDPPLR